MQQTFWLIGRSVYYTVQPNVVERRNAICPQLYEAPDLAQLSPQNNDENDDVFEVCDNDGLSSHIYLLDKIVLIIRI